MITCRDTWMRFATSNSIWHALKRKWPICPMKEPRKYGWGPQGERAGGGGWWVNLSVCSQAKAREDLVAVTTWWCFRTNSVYLACLCKLHSLPSCFVNFGLCFSSCQGNHWAINWSLWATDQGGVKPDKPKGCWSVCIASRGKASGNPFFGSTFLPLSPCHTQSSYSCPWLFLSHLGPQFQQ